MQLVGGVNNMKTDSQLTPLENFPQGMSFTLSPAFVIK